MTDKWGIILKLNIQAYQQGRSWLASNIRSWADPKDPTRADQLEEQTKLVFYTNIHNKLIVLINFFSWLTICIVCGRSVAKAFYKIR